MKNHDEVQEICRGYSGAKKYMVKADGKSYFLKIQNWSARENVENMLQNAGVVHAHIFETGKIDYDFYLVEDIASLYGKGEGRVHYTGKISGKSRISDDSILNGDNSILQEVKNVKYQGYTKQMKDYVAELGKTIKQGDDTIIFRYLELFVRKKMVEQKYLQD